MKIRKTLPILALTVVLAGCGTRYEVIKDNPPTGGSLFDAALFNGYIQLADMERGEFDWSDGRNFANRAELVALGNNPDPEAIASRDLAEEHVGELSSARERLMAAFDKGARERVAGPAAKAQVMFDCWMQEQEEDLQPDHIAKCRADFELAMKEVEDALAPKVVKAPEPAPEPAPAPAPEPALPALPANMMVYFDFDSSELTTEARGIIGQIATAFSQTKATSVTLFGHTDTSGANAYNAELAERRVNTVRNALIGAGLKADGVLTRAFGESRPAVDTGDGKQEAMNRRVEVSFQR